MILPVWILEMPHKSLSLQLAVPQDQTPRQKAARVIGELQGHLIVTKLHAIFGTSLFRPISVAFLLPNFLQETCKQST